MTLSVRITRRRALVVGALLALLVTVGSALALWAFTTRSGGSAKVGADTATVTVSPAATPAADLYPGFSVGVKVDVTNANAVPVTLTDIGVANVSPSDLVITGADGACPAANFTAAWSAMTGLSIPIPVGTTTVTLPGQTLALAAGAPVGCKNA